MEKARKRSWLFLAVMLLGLGMLPGIQAQAAESTVIHGDVVCFGCALKKEQGAKAQCSVYGHVNAVRLGDGKIWSILENDQSKELVQNHDYAGKHVHIQGRQIPEAQTIEVESFEVASDGSHSQPKDAPKSEHPAAKSEHPSEHPA